VDVPVALESATGSATVRLGASSPVPYPVPGNAVLSVPRTVGLPLDAFTAVGLVARTQAFREAVEALGGYDTREMGRRIR
jgi:hypothetical protein